MKIRRDKNRHLDTVYRREFPAGVVALPGHNGKDAGGYYGVSHLCIIREK